MDINEDKYFYKSEQDKRFLQKLALHEYLSHGIESGFTDQETRDYMKEEMYWAEDQERYEAAALLRDTIELFDKEIGQHRKLFH